jgi:F-type H+-transporting ATPase subunit epsilon
MASQSDKNTFFLQVVSPLGTTFSGDVDEVTIPTTQGTITVLPHHTSLFTQLDHGEVYIKQGNKRTSLALFGGFLEVQNNTANIISEYAVDADSIQIARVQEARRRAEEIMKNKKETVEFVIAKKDLQKSLLELKVSEKVKKRRGIAS